jgi:hypothetical protein
MLDATDGERMRSVDRPVPTINTDDRPPVEPFPAILHIGIERQPIAVYVWDDETAFWDDPDQQYVWDDLSTFPYDRFDLWCDFYGLTISLGDPDPSGVFASASVEMTLDNRDGSLSQYDETGRLIDWQPGSPLDIWATYDGGEYWLFSGRITAWREMADATLEVEAFDAFSSLNQFVGRWTPGNVGDSVAARLNKICTRAGYTGTKRFATGHVTLLTEQVDDRTPLEMMQAAAMSDGGALFCDADGTVVYVDRNWISGRPDQTTVAVLSDNWCEGTDPLWEPVLLTDDDAIVNIAVLANIAEPPVQVEARNEPSILRHDPQTFPSNRIEDLWETESQGQLLADWTVDQRGNHFLRLEQGLLYAHDRRVNLWPIVLDARIGDLVDYIHEQPAVDGPQLIALTLIINRVIHDITPDTWVTTISTTRAVDHRDFVLWDRTTFTWDDTDTRAVWAI